MTSTLEQQQQNRKNFLWLFISLFSLGVFFLGSTYLFVLVQKVDNPQEPLKNQTAANQKEIHAISTTVNTIQPRDLQKDFTQINQELKNL